jgi:hypothetical protein
MTLQNALSAQAAFVPPRAVWTAKEGRGSEYGYWEACVVSESTTQAIEVTKRDVNHNCVFRFYFYSPESFLAWTKEGCL